ncbi:MAG TPA: DUF5719 family protein [Acidimicrobiales bacterium]|nr:DUF5719 family protein [Acidimicrobiales bacterium]
MNQPDASGRKRAGRVARLPILAVIAGLLIAGGLADRKGTGHAAASAAQIQPMPVAAPASALSSSWFCAGARGQPDKVADGQLVVANASEHPLHGAALLIPSQGPSVTVPISVGADNRATVSEAAAGSAPFVGALVQLDGGAAAVEQVVTGAQGMSTAACATAGSDHWYFADGTTQENSNLFISLLNPYPEDAIVDLSFTTEQGAEAPSDFQGVVVPAKSLIGLDLGTHLRRRAQLATTVSVRTGRIVAFKTQVATAGTAPATSPRVPGLSLILGAPSPATSLWWPDGLTADGMTERYQIYNPTQTEADVSLSVALDQGSADPFAIKVPPGGTGTVVSNTEPRVPKGVGHAAELRTTTGVGVVAERTIDAVAPASRLGLVDVGGSRLQARRWLLAAGSANSSLNESVVIYNPGTTAADVSVVGLGGSIADINGLSGLILPPGRRLVVRINDRSPSLDRALLVEASADVIVERDLSRVNAIGTDATIGVPLNAS